MGNKLFHRGHHHHHHKDGKQENGGKHSSVNKSPSKQASDILTDEEVEHIQLCWPHLRPHMKDIMMEAFLELFRECPDVKDKFMGFKNYSVADLERKENGKENALQRHIPRITRAVVKVINHADNLDAVLDYCECIGRIHHRNGIDAIEMAAVGPFFVNALKERLPDKYKHREDMLDAWARFFYVMTDLTKRGYPNAEIGLSEEEKLIVRTTFCILRENMSEVGIATFMGLFHTHSTSKVYFPVFRDSPLEDLEMSEALQNHGMRIMRLVETFVCHLDRPANSEEVKKQEAFYNDLGKAHQSMGVEKEFLDVMGPVFCQSIRPILQEENKWDVETRNAWLHVFRIIVLKLKKGYEGVPDHKFDADDASPHPK